MKVLKEATIQSFVFLPSYLPDELHDQNLEDP